MQEFRTIQIHPRHFVIERGGVHIPIARHILSRDLFRHVLKRCHGGTMHYDEGGKVVSPTPAMDAAIKDAQRDVASKPASSFRPEPDEPVAPVTVDRPKPIKAVNQVKGSPLAHGGRVGYADGKPPDTSADAVLAGDDAAPATQPGSARMQSALASVAAYNKSKTGRAENARSPDDDEPSIYEPAVADDATPAKPDGSDPAAGKHWYDSPDAALATEAETPASTGTPTPLDDSVLKIPGAQHEVADLTDRGVPLADALATVRKRHDEVDEKLAEQSRQSQDQDAKDRYAYLTSRGVASDVATKAAGIGQVMRPVVHARPSAPIAPVTAPTAQSAATTAASPSAPASGAPAVAAPSTPITTPSPSADVDAYNTAATGLKTAADQTAATASRKAAQEVRDADATQQQQRDQAALAQGRYQKLLEGIDQQTKWLQEHPVDPNHIWHTGGNKPLALAAIILGGFSLDPNGRNGGLEAVDEAVRNDINAQVKNIGVRQSIVSSLVEQGHTVREAADIAGVFLKEQVAQQALKTAAQYGGTEAKNAAATFKANVDAQKVPALQQIAVEGVKRDYAEAAMREQLAHTQASTNALNAKASNALNAKARNARIGELAAKISAGTATPEERQEYRAIAQKPKDLLKSNISVVVEAPSRGKADQFGDPVTATVAIPATVDDPAEFKKAYFPARQFEKDARTLNTLVKDAGAVGYFDPEKTGAAKELLTKLKESYTRAMVGASRVPSQAILKKIDESIADPTDLIGQAFGGNKGKSLELLREAMDNRADVIRTHVERPKGGYGEFGIKDAQ